MLMYKYPDDNLEKVRDIKEKIFKKSSELLDLIKTLYSVPGNKGIKSNRKKIFICYSHNDKEWKDKLERHLKPLEEKGKIEYWSDERIQPGEKWKTQITQALETSTIAIVFISVHFFASRFITVFELPKLLEKSNRQKTEIIPLIIGHCRFKRDKDLSQFQAINDPEKPLEGLTKCEQEKVPDSLAEEIEKILENVNDDKENRQSHRNLS
jgi:hypothetical protein